MKENIITDPGRAYIFGLATAFFGLFLSYLWSPDYAELINNGYSFLYMSCFMISLFITTWVIDGYYETKAKRKNHSKVPGEKNE